MLTLCPSTASSGALWLLHDTQFVGELFALACSSGDGMLRLVMRRHDGWSGRHLECCWLWLPPDSIGRNDIRNWHYPGAVGDQADGSDRARNVQIIPLSTDRPDRSAIGWFCKFPPPRPESTSSLAEFPRSGQPLLRGRSQAVNRRESGVPGTCGLERKGESDSEGNGRLDHESKL